MLEVTAMTGDRLIPIAKKTIIFFAFPFALSAVLIVMYFSGVDVLQQIISPTIEGMAPDSCREFGLLENAQNLFILAMVVACVIGILRNKSALYRSMLAILALFATFILLEEIDYGLHFIEYFNGVSGSESVEVRNLHNRGDVTSLVKRLVDVAMVVFFGLLPLLFLRKKDSAMARLLPSPYSLMTLIAMFMARTLAHTLKDMGLAMTGSISQGNISEFRELLTYYIFMLYVLRLAFNNVSAAQPLEDTPHMQAS